MTRPCVSNLAIESHKLCSEEEYEDQSELMFCRICGAELQDLKAFADHVRAEHAEEYSSGDTQHCPEDQTHINYYDLGGSVKTEVEIEQEDCFSFDATGLASLACEDVVNTVTKSEGESGRNKHDFIILVKVEDQNEIGCDSEQCPPALQNGRDALSRHTSNGTPQAKKPRIEAKPSEECEKNVKAKETSKVKHRLKNGKGKEKVTNIKRERTKLKEEKPYACHACVFKTKEKNALEIHMRKHSGEKPFHCTECEYRSNNKNNLLRHKKKHSGEKPFACSFCQYRCIQNSDLKNHMRIHTGLKPYSCDYCDYKCSLKQSLILHTRTHTGEKPLKCPLCGYRCNRHGDLKIHMSIHEIEKKFVCDICSRRFSVKKYLRTHVLHHMSSLKSGSGSTFSSSGKRSSSHTGEKHLACEVCDYKCCDRRGLKRHMDTHPLVCKICDYKSKRRSSLTRHVRRWHNDCVS